MLPEKFYHDPLPFNLKPEIILCHFPFRLFYPQQRIIEGNIKIPQDQLHFIPASGKTPGFQKFFILLECGMFLSPKCPRHTISGIIVYLHSPVTLIHINYCAQFVSGHIQEPQWESPVRYNQFFSHLRVFAQYFYQYHDRAGDCFLFRFPPLNRFFEMLTRFANSACVSSSFFRIILISLPVIESGIANVTIPHPKRALSPLKR